MRRLLRALRDEQAVTTVEYAVLLALILLVLLGSAALLGEHGNGMWTSIHSNLTESGALK
jgi:Flp pilus assembly pilin Flp